MTGQGKSAIDTLLAESFKELALKQPIEKITIKEITDKAGVIRPTFYNHFQDKYDLLEWIIDKELLEPVEPLIQNGMINEALVLLFGSIERDKEFYRGQAGWRDRTPSAALHKAVWSVCCYRSSKDRRKAERAGTCG